MTLREKLLYRRYQAHILIYHDYLDPESKNYVLDMADGGYLLLHSETHEIKRYFYKCITFNTLAQMSWNNKVLSNIQLYFKDNEIHQPYNELKQILKEIKTKPHD